MKVMKQDEPCGHPGCINHRSHPCEGCGRIAGIEGYLPPDDLRRAFVMGAKWWEFRQTGATMWQSDRNAAEEEAELRYPGGKVANPINESPS